MNVSTSRENTQRARREAGTLIRLGIPIYIAQMSNMGMVVVDTLMTGRYNTADMAAVAVASSLWAPVSLFGMGVLLTLTPFTARLVGAGKADNTPHMLRQGLVCSALLSVPLMVFFYIISNYLHLFGLEPDLATLAGDYLRVMLWGLPGFFIFINMRCFLEGFSQTRPAMIVAFLGLALNIPCNYVLIYGLWGLPALGAVGCAIATVLCHWFMALCMTFYIRIIIARRGLAPFLSMCERSVDWPLIARIFRVGLPNALALLFEVAFFALTALLLAPLGTVAVAGHHIALNVAALLFMLPLSIGGTATIRVGHCLGAGDHAQARCVAWTALGVGLAFACINGLGTALFRETIAGLYTSDPHVIALAAHLLLYAAAFQIVDGIQVVGIGILRGYNDTKIIFIVCFVAYCIMGLPLGFLLSRTDWLAPAWGPSGFWLAYVVSLGMGAVCYTARIVYLHISRA